MRVINLNPDTDIGASAWFVEIDGHRLLMDAGVHPKIEGRRSLPTFSAIANEDVDAIAISHCHHDHVGALPMAVRHFPKAHVFMTDLSYFLVERVLHNSVNVMTRQREELGILEYPLFTHDEVDDIEPSFQAFKCNREIEWAAFEKTRGGAVSPTLEFHDAGHALGAAGIMVRGQHQTLFYTGDVCFHDQTILKAARFEDIKAEVLIMETTRGAREPKPGFTRAAEINRLALAISNALERGGSVMIPVFALGRTQEILAVLALLMREGKLRRQAIYIGGLGRVFTEIYDLEAHRTHRNLTNLRLTEALELIVLDKNATESMRLNSRRIFVVTAGMMTEQTPAHELAVRMAGDPKHAIFFVGYADPGSPAGRLKAARQGETFMFSAKAGMLTKDCEVDDFDLSAHANREELLDFVGQVGPHTVFLGHGDAPARAWFEQQIHARWPKIKIHQPQPGVAIEA
ncbi:MAG TPA: MBL fold metallo-hydrolase [Methylomirabilota bacterium]|nr:MBL fold metallo-hydrolase [Methylomirabilota bacterium]